MRSTVETGCCNSWLRFLFMSSRDYRLRRGTRLLVIASSDVVHGCRKHVHDWRLTMARTLSSPVRMLRRRQGDRRLPIYRTGVHLVFTLSLHVADVA